MSSATASRRALPRPALRTDPRVGYTRRKSAEVNGQFAGYRIDSVVGGDGMGVVYRVYAPGLGRPVAPQLIAPEALADATARERFVSETRYAASIEDSHVVAIYAAGPPGGAGGSMTALTTGVTAGRAAAG